MVSAAAKKAKGLPAWLTKVRARWWRMSSRQQYTACVREKAQKKARPASVT